MRPYSKAYPEPLGAAPIRRSAARRGLTLMEIVLVIVILIVVASVAMPMMRGPMMSQRLIAAADQVRAEWAAARARAMESGETFTFRCELGGNRYVIEPQSEATAVSLGRSGASVDPLTGQATGSASPTGDFEPAIWSRRVEGTLPVGTFFADATTGDPGGSSSVTMGAAGFPVLSDADILGGNWSEPTVFFCDGTASTTLVLLKSDHDECVEVALRGLTGLVSIGKRMSAANYTGPLDAGVTRTLWK